MAGVDVSKLTGFATLGSPPGAVDVSKLIAFVILSEGAAPSAVVASSDLTFSLPDAVLTGDGVATAPLAPGTFDLTFDLPAALVTGTGLLDSGAAGIQLQFTTSLELLNPISFPQMLGLSGACAKPRLAAAPCQERVADYWEDSCAGPRVAAAPCQERTADYYMEE